jgi:hypothetical protein
MRINLKKWVGVVLVYCCSVFFLNNVQAQAESAEDSDEWQYAGAIYLSLANSQFKPLPVARIVHDSVYPIGSY